MMKLEKTGAETQLSPKEKSIYMIIQNRPNIQSGEIAVYSCDVDPSFLHVDPPQGGH